MLYTKQRCKRLREKGSPSQIFYHLLNAYNQSEVLLHVELSHTGSAIPAAVGMAGTAGMAALACKLFTL